MFRCLLWAIAATVRPKALLIADNLCLRQQLLVLQRRNPRPGLKDADRHFWILLCRCFIEWRTSLLIVKPETVLRRHRHGWRTYWSRAFKSEREGGSPPCWPGATGADPAHRRGKSIVGTAKEPSRIGEARVQSVRQNRRQVHPTTHSGKAITGLAVIPEATRSDRLGV
jgi:hypothetical protein